MNDILGFTKGFFFQIFTEILANKKLERTFEFSFYYSRPVATVDVLPKQIQLNTV